MIEFHTRDFYFSSYSPWKLIKLKQSQYFSTVNREEMNSRKNQHQLNNRVIFTPVTQFSVSGFSSLQTETTKRNNPETTAESTNAK